MLRSFTSVAALALLATAASACSAAPGDGASAIASEGEAASKTTYLDIADYWTTGPQQDTWFAAVGNLKQQFDAICGDTFCGGDYSNLQALGLTCAVSKARGSVKGCTWEFVGSYEVVNATTGAVKTSAPHYACSFDPTGDATQLAAVLGATGSLHATLPGLTKSVYDVLGDCFQHPIGASNPNPPGTGPYGTALDVSNQDGWIAMTNALNDSFDQVCGDTFCEGDYSNLASLRLTCGVNAKTQKIAKCVWVFGGSYAQVTASTGTIHETARTFVCDIPVKGTAQQMIDALTAPGSVDAIHRPLPGGTASAYDALGGCL